MPPKRLQLTYGRHSDTQDTEDPAALLALIAALSLEDVDEVRKQSAGRSHDGTLTDEEIALQLFAEEAMALDSFAHDIAVAQSLDKALESDVNLLEELARMEEMARRDREYAIAISQGRRPTYREVEPLRRRIESPSAAPTERRQIEPPPLNRIITSPATLSIAPPSTGAVLALSSEKGPSSTVTARAATCVICRDVIEGPVIRAPCNDTYDVGCLVDLYRAATVDESLFPPACCRQAFKIEEVRTYLDRNLLKVVEKKTIEFGTKDRVYCCTPTCSAFLGAATVVAADLLCTVCWVSTCAHCKKAAHSKSIQCTSEEDASVVALAEAEGWKRCPGCGHLVELTIGCYHMICRCRYQFCYLCTAKWKTCRCIQWDENRLIAVAEDRVQRQGVQAPARGGNAVAFRERVAREAERLRVDHNCIHRWRYVVTAGNCEGCGHYLRQFLFQCRGCQMWCCARCRRNRWV